MSEDEINAAGYEGEKGYHGTPSGIDNTASTYGGVLRFQRVDGKPQFDPKKLSSPCPSTAGSCVFNRLSRRDYRRPTVSNYSPISFFLSIL